MNDQTTPQPKKSRNYVLPIVGGVAAVALVGYLASRSGLDKEMLRQQVDAFATALHASAEKQGRDVTFTYGEVAIEGSFSSKHGVIRDAKLTIKPLNRPDASKDALVLATPIAEVYPKAADLSAIQIQLPQPVEFTSETDPAKKLLTVKSITPLTLDVAQMEENKVNYLDLLHPLPTKVDFIYLREQQAQGTEDTTPTLVPVYKTISLNVAAGGQIHSHTSADGKGTLAVDVRDVHVVPEGVPNGEITIAEIVVNSSNVLNEKSQSIGALKVHVGDVTASPDVIPYAPIALTIDGAYEGAATPQDTASIGKQASVLKLTNFALTTKEAKLTAQADFVANSGEMLPEGTANVTLTNVPYVLKELRDNKLLSAPNEAMITPLLEMTTGQKIAEITDAVIDIKRPQGGAFTIGKTTFEELFATVLKSALTHEPAPVVSGDSKAPDAAKPADKKAPEKGAMIEDNSARG